MRLRFVRDDQRDSAVYVRLEDILGWLRESMEGPAGRRFCDAAERDLEYAAEQALKDWPMPERRAS